ncbi:hypothetical protein BH09BAC3_BH09BAC3_07740 [soil metagenome]
MPRDRNSMRQESGNKYFELLVTVFLFMSLLTNAQTFKLDFKPNRPIVRFYFDSLTIYTDTTSLFLIYEKYGTKGLEDYNLRIKHHILTQFNLSKSDTISFKGDLIPFNDNIDDQKWYVDWAIQNLTRNNLLIIYDKHRQLVTTIETKRIGTKKEGHVRRAFINKDTKEELFHELIFLRTVQRRYKN